MRLQLFFTLTQIGRTALYLASENGRIDVVRVLIEAHADIHSQDKVWSTSPQTVMRVHFCDFLSGYLLIFKKPL